MVTPIDVMRGRCNEQSYWGEVRTACFLPYREAGNDALRPARGIMFGLLLSGMFWAGLIAAGRVVFSCFR